MGKRLTTEEKTKLYTDMFGGEPGIDFVVQVDEEVTQVTEAEARALRDENAALKRRIAELEAAAVAGKRAPKRRGGGERDVGDEADARKVDAPRAAASADGTLDEALYQAIRRRLSRDPAVLCVMAVKPELRVEITRHVVEVSHSTLRGRLAELISEGFFETGETGNAAYNELRRRGFSTAKPNVYRELDKLAELGFLTKEEGGFQAVEDMVVNVVRKK